MKCMECRVWNNGLCGNESNMYQHSRINRYWQNDGLLLITYCTFIYISLLLFSTCSVWNSSLCPHIGYLRLLLNHYQITITDPRSKLTSRLMRGWLPYHRTLHARFLPIRLVCWRKIATAQPLLDRTAVRSSLRWWVVPQQPS